MSGKNNSPFAMLMATVVATNGNTGDKGGAKSKSEPTNPRHVTTLELGSSTKLLAAFNRLGDAKLTTPLEYHAGTRPRDKRLFAHIWMVAAVDESRYPNKHVLISNVVQNFLGRAREVGIWEPAFITSAVTNPAQRITAFGTARVAGEDISAQIARDGRKIAVIAPPDWSPKRA